MYEHMNKSNLRKKDDKKNISEIFFQTFAIYKEDRFYNEVFRDRSVSSMLLPEHGC